ncbi:MAG: glycosyltransferase family 4 protein [Planctomycetota bacterium]
MKDDPAPIPGMGTALRVAFIIDSREPARGGAEASLEAFARALERRGHRVTFLTMAEPRGEGDSRYPHEVIRVPRHPRWLREILFAVRSCERAQSEAFDVAVGFRHVPDVDVFEPHGGRHARAAAASIEARGRGLVGSVRRLFRPIAPRQLVFSWAERTLLRRAPPAILVALSRSVLADFKCAYPTATAEWHLVPGAVDLAKFHPPEGVEERERARMRLACPVGRESLLLVAHNPCLKGLATALRALARPELENAHLAWVGRGKPASFRRLARRLGVAHRFTGLGSCERTELLYRGADVLVHPTHHDPCSLVVLEALASGLPVVTTARNGAAEVIVEHGGGRVIEDPDDVEGLARAVRELLDAPAEIRLTARAAAETRPIEERLQRLVELVEEAVRGRRARRLSVGLD